MAKYCLKKPSRRVSCKKRYKIEKNVKEHSRKRKKAGKKTRLQKQAKKLITIPGKCPFKAEMLQSLGFGDGNVQLDTAIKNAVKKRKKDQKKLANRVRKEVDTLSAALVGTRMDADYNFAMLE